VHKAVAEAAPRTADDEPEAIASPPEFTAVVAREVFAISASPVPTEVDKLEDISLLQKFERKNQKQLRS